MRIGKNLFHLQYLPLSPPARAGPSLSEARPVESRSKAKYLRADTACRFTGLNSARGRKHRQALNGRSDASFSTQRQPS